MTLHLKHFIKKLVVLVFSAYFIAPLEGMESEDNPHYCDIYSQKTARDSASSLANLCTKVVLKNYEVLLPAIREQKIPLEMLRDLLIAKVASIGVNQEVPLFGRDSARVRKMVTLPTSQGWRIITGACDGTLSLWNLSGKLEHKWLTPGVNALAAVETSDGLRVVTCSNALNVWDSQGALLASSSLYSRFVESIEVLREEDKWRIITPGESYAALIRDFECNPIARCMGKVCRKRLFAAFSTVYGNRIAAGYSKKKLGVWDLQGQLLYLCRGHTADLQALSPVVTLDSYYVVSGASNKTVCVWDKSGGLVFKINKYENVSAVTGVQTNQGELLFAASFLDCLLKNNICVWNIQGKLVGFYKLDDEACIVSLQFVEGPLGLMLVSIDSDGHVLMRDLQKGVIARCRESSHLNVCFGNYGWRIVSKSKNQGVMAWDVLDVYRGLKNINYSQAHDILSWLKKREGRLRFFQFLSEFFSGEESRPDADLYRYLKKILDQEKL